MRQPAAVAFRWARTVAAWAPGAARRTRRFVMTLAGFAGLTVAAWLTHPTAGIAVGSILVIVFDLLLDPPERDAEST